MPWSSLLAFVHIVTHPRIFQTPASTAAAWGQVQEWLDRDNVFVPEPTSRHAEILGELVAQVDRPNLVPDAHLAALAIEYGLALQTTDGDFARFPGLSWENPLAWGRQGHLTGEPWNSSRSSPPDFHTTRVRLPLGSIPVRTEHGVARQSGTA